MPAKGEKKKIKRKRGKKFNYNPLSVNQEVKEVKANPFEAVSTQKFTKLSKNSDLKKEYRSIFSNNTSNFIDKRIGENSKLSEEEKARLRYKSFQLLNLKKKKASSGILGNNNMALTHKGKVIDKHNLNDEEVDEIEDDYDYDIAQELFNAENNNANLSKRELFNQLIEKSKQDREEKKKKRKVTSDKVNLLDENFAEINDLLKKRKREFERKNDDYHINITKYQYADKTTPTTRLKTDEEIEKAKQEKLKKLEKKKNDETDEEDNDSENDSEEDVSRLTKKERIGKLIEKRLAKAQKIAETKNIVSSKKEEENDSENESDNDEDEDENEEYDEEEDGEDDDNENEEYDDDDDNDDEEEQGEDYDDDDEEVQDEDDDDDEYSDLSSEKNTKVQVKKVTNAIKPKVLK
jgi:hypothetical protein